jgi:poly(3-hydroxybutyrate) depolymerase
MSVIMGATYPDVFAAVAVGAGLEYKAATSMVNAFSAMSSGGPDPVGQGDLAYRAQGSYSRPLAVSTAGVTHNYNHRYSSYTEPPITL